MTARRGCAPVVLGPWRARLRKAGAGGIRAGRTTGPIGTLAAAELLVEVVDALDDVLLVHPLDDVALGAGVLGQTLDLALLLGGEDDDRDVAAEGRLLQDLAERYGYTPITED